MVQLSGRNSKAVYLLMMAVSIVLAILLKFAFEGNLNKLFSFGSCNGGSGCLGNQAVYRVSFGVGILFLFYSLFTALHNPFHYRHWTAKIIAFCGAVVIPFFIPNSVFTVYAEIARVISLFFLLLQIFILIDLAYDIHQYLLESKIEQENGEANKTWQILYLLLSCGALAAAFVGIGLLFHFYGHCPLHQFFIAFTLILGLILFFISITERAGVGMLVPSVVFAYCVYVTWKAVYSNPDQTCNPRDETYNNSGMLALGLIITATSLTYTTWSASVSGANLFRKPKEEAPVEDDPNAVNMGAASVAPTKKQSSGGDVEKAEGAAAGTAVDAPAANEQEQTFRNHWFFHMVMAMGAIYMSMLLTNWGSPSGGTKDETAGVSVESMWVQIVTVWLTFLLFMWTVMAPFLFPDRDFSDNHNSFMK